MSGTDFGIIESSRVVSVGGARYVVGLTWQYNQENERIETRAKRLAVDFGADLLCITRTQKSFGYGNTSDGIRRGMVSLAGTFTNSILEDTSSVLGLFELEEGLYYVIAIRQGVVLATSDKVFERAGDAASVFERAYQDGQWDTVFAPAYLGQTEIDSYLAGTEIDAFDQTPIAELIGSAQKVKLRPATSRGDVLKFVGVAAVVLLIGAGGHLLWERHQAIVAERHALALEMMRERIASEHGTQAMAVPPYQGQPLFFPMLQECYSTMSNSLVEAPGWDLKALSCDPTSIPVQNPGAPGVARIPAPVSGGPQGTVSATFTRDGGTIAWLHSAYSTTQIKWDNGNGVTVPFPLPKVPTIQAGVKVQESLAWETAWVASRLDEVFATYTIKPGAQPPAPRPGQNSNAVVPFWPSVDIEVKSPEVPIALATILSKIPAMNFRGLAYDTESHTWTLSAEMYGPVTYLRGVSQ
jgi:hypothetical protein